MQSSKKSPNSATTPSTEEQSAAEGSKTSTFSDYDILMNMQEGVIVQAADGSLIAHNPAAERILGVSAAEILRYPDITPYMQAIHKNGSPFPIESHPSQVTLRTGETQANVTMGFYNLDETLTWVDVNSQPLCHPGETQPHAVITTFRDVTSRVEDELILRRSESRFRLLTENAQDVIYRYQLAPKPGLEYISPVVANFTGFTPDDYYHNAELGNAIVHPDDQHLRNALSASPFLSPLPIMVQWEHKDGHMLWVEQYNVPIYDDEEALIGVEGVARNITERQQVRDRISWLAKFPEELPHPVLRVSPEGTILYANAAGKPLLEFWEDGLRLNLSELKDVRQLITESLESEETLESEITANERALFLTLAPDAKGKYVNVYGLDITERKQAEQALRESERTTRMFIESAPVGVVIVDERGIITLVNGSTTKLFGYTHEEMVGQPLSMLVPERLREMHQHQCTDYFKSPYIRPMGANLNLQAIRKDGSIFPVEISLGSVKTQEGKLAMAFVMDITERQEVEQLRDAMIHTMVHDLRSPLSSIMTALQMITLENVSHLDSAQQELLDIAMHSTERLLYLVNAILDVSRLESGKMPLDRSHIVVNFMVQNALAPLSPLAEERHITLDTDISMDLPSVWVDTQLFERVLQNLIGNAIKFTPKDGKIDITAVQDETVPSRIQVSVKDTGPGIPQELRAQLFQKFVTGKGAGRGSGLGLTFCKLVLEAHGERIWIESETGQGTTVTFTLPVSDS